MSMILSITARSTMGGKKAAKCSSLLEADQRIEAYILSS